MELQFYKTTHPCLQQVKREIQNQEQTQELRLSDGMPEIGSVLGAWGQVLLRSKEWRNGEMHVSGGVMVWVLYKPEDGLQIQCVDTWIPFQMKWDLPETERDGIIHANGLLRCVDARSTSSRKLMVRVCVGVLGQASISAEVENYLIEDIPEDVQLLKHTYPLCLPREAGEKLFTLEETLSLPPNAPVMEKLLYYTLQAEILDRKVMGGKVVFRGNANFHIVYISSDAQVYNWDFDIPFSQYSDLDRDYDPDATVSVSPAVTAMEVEVDPEGKLRLKSGITAQYMISSCTMVDVVEDAYSTKRQMQLKFAKEHLPVILEENIRLIPAEFTLQAQANRVADVAFYFDHPQLQRDDNAVNVQMPAQFQVLYYDENGMLQSTLSRWTGSYDIQLDDKTALTADILPAGKAHALMTGSGVELQGDINLQTLATTKQPLTMVCALELGEEKHADPDRPSLILRKAGKDSLWQIAKKTGSTVASICAANNLDDEPFPGQMLLIPIS